jgi:hypothetical protein
VKYSNIRGWVLNIMQTQPIEIDQLRLNALNKSINEWEYNNQYHKWIEDPYNSLYSKNKENFFETVKCLIEIYRTNSDLIRPHLAQYNLAPEQVDQIYSDLLGYCSKIDPTLQKIKCYNVDQLINCVIDNNDTNIYWTKGNSIEDEIIAVVGIDKCWVLINQFSKSADKIKSWQPGKQYDLDFSAFLDNTRFLKTLIEINSCTNINRTIQFLLDKDRYVREFAEIRLGKLIEKIFESV